MDLPEMTCLETTVFDKVRGAFAEPDENCLDLSDYPALGRLRKKGIVEPKSYHLTALGTALAAALDA